MRPAERVVVVRSSVATWSSIGQAELAQALDGPLEPDAPRRALRGELRLERLVVGVHPEAQDVQLAVLQAEMPRVDDRVDLDAGDQLDGAGTAPAAATSSR